MDRFKGLGLVDRVPEGLWMEVCSIVQEAASKATPKKKESKKAKLVIRGSSVRGILQARVLECIAMPFSRGLP